MSVGRKLLSSLVKEGSLTGFIDLNLHPDLFKESEAILYKFVRNHVANFGKLPSESTIAEKVGDVLLPTDETPEYYMAEVEARYLHNTLKEAVLSSQDALKLNDATKAFELLTERINHLHFMKHRQELFDFRDVATFIHKVYVAQQASDDSSTLSFGWPTVDKSTGGLFPGDFASINGRPATGKTFLSLYLSLHAWDNCQHLPLVVSMEMMLKPLAQRLAAMKASKPLTRLMKGMMTTKAYTEMMISLKDAKNKQLPFWLVDGNLTATGQDILMLARQLKPSCVFVDGAYLLGHENPRLSRFERITTNAEFLKQRIATDLGIPVVASYQLNRDATKKKKDKNGGGEEAGLEDIYGTDAIGQLSTLAFGMFQAEGVETMTRRRVKILKGRNGEMGDFEINWDFQKMDFSEVSEENPEELQFID